MDRTTIICWLVTALACAMAGAYADIVGNRSGAGEPLRVASLSLRDENRKQVLLVRPEGLLGNWTSTAGAMDLNIGDRKQLTIGSGRKNMMTFETGVGTLRPTVRLQLGESGHESTVLEIPVKDKARLVMRNGGVTWLCRSDAMELNDAPGTSGIRLGLTDQGDPAVTARTPEGTSVWNVQGVQMRDSKDRVAAILGEQNDQGFPHLRVHHEDGSVHGWMKAPSWGPLPDDIMVYRQQPQEYRLWHSREGGTVVLHRADGRLALFFSAGGAGFNDGKRSAMCGVSLFSGCYLGHTSGQDKFVRIPYAQIRASAAFHQEK